MTRRYGDEPDFGPGVAYDGVLLVAQALEKARGDVSASSPVALAGSSVPSVPSVPSPEDAVHATATEAAAMSANARVTSNEREASMSKSPSRQDR